MRDLTAKRLSALHRSAYRLTGGRIGKRLVNNDMLLLTTTGRRSGTSHTVPLLFLPDRDDVIVIASWGGRDYPPDWYANLVQQPQVAVQVDGRRWEAQAAVMAPPERDLWWQRAVEAYDGYRDYQSRTERLIPIVRISPSIDRDETP